jgi:hypothetical protein
MLKPGAGVGKPKPPPRALFQGLSLQRLNGRLSATARAMPVTDVWS